MLALALKQQAGQSALRNVSRSAAAALVQTRNAHDLMIRKKTGQPIIKYGAGGRSSVSGHTATVFGCTGFLGRYIVSKLAKQGTQVVVPWRDEDSKRHLRVTGDLGQVVPLEFDLKNRQTLVECVRHSDVVYNLIGRDYETKNFTFDQVNHEAARAIAEVSAEAGVARLIHVSALNADENSPSKFLKTKALGEKAVRQVMPDATIVRPAIMYGQEDRFLNRIGLGVGWEYSLNDGNTRVHPVHVLDVAQALEIMLKAESTAGKTYELYGPKEYTFNEIWELARDVVKKPLTTYLVPKFAAKWTATVLNMTPFDLISPDQVERMYISDTLQPNALTFADLYIEPSSLESQAIAFLRRFRSTAYFDLPVEKDDGKVVKGVYHVID
ncbi:hypothetical protein BC937DRAFT_91171 [Endogone sp. FLAS-F59071]|nr:hypothetical protein BC937DRAFT_91171 [Endogone sp. FLAS-F59071]|eukprot:RUS16462.1 hypothetical protein BC937DRAFT_91171 [Endogone sp. FLAS-F59071]